MKKKSKKSVKKEDKTKYAQFKVKKAKLKAKAKSKPKVKPKVKPKAKKAVGNFDKDSDWRLKEVHHDINKVRKSVYDLSINDEGEHDDIVIKLQRAHDRLEILEGYAERTHRAIDTMATSMVKLKDLDALGEKVDAIVHRMFRKKGEDMIKGWNDGRED